MGDRKGFLLRIDGELLEDLRRWADDELRSLNGQIEYVLRRALQDSGRGRNPHGAGKRAHGTDAGIRQPGEPPDSPQTGR